MCIAQLARIFCLYTRNNSTHRGVIEAKKTWCATYHISAWEGVPSFTMAHCKIATQPCQKMLANACQYMEFVQCESRNMPTWRPYTNIQRVEEGVPFHQQCGVWVLVIHLRHQTLCEWQHRKYVLDWPISSNTWPVKIDTNLLKEEVLVLEEVSTS